MEGVNKKEMCEWCGWPLSENCCLKGREKVRNEAKHSEALAKARGETGERGE
jgi:hypothetical protein